MSGQVSRGSAGEYKADEQELSRGSAGDYQADEEAGVARLRLRNNCCLLVFYNFDIGHR